MSNYFIKTKPDGKAQGPFSGTQIKTFAAKGKIKPDHLVSVDQNKWMPASKIKGLAFPQTEKPAEAKTSPDKVTNKTKLTKQMEEEPASTEKNKAGEKDAPQAGTGKTATCDQCNASIPEGGGYIFYSTASSGMNIMPGAMQETGNMFLCDECTNKICSASGFAKTIPDAQEISAADLLGDPMKMINMMRDANHVSIVKRCKAHGLSPAQAKGKAREFASIWWQDRDKAQTMSAEFWKSDGNDEKLNIRKLPFAYCTSSGEIKKIDSCLDLLSSVLSNFNISLSYKKTVFRKDIVAKYQWYSKDDYSGIICINSCKLVFKSKNNYLIILSIYYDINGKKHASKKKKVVEEFILIPTLADPSLPVILPPEALFLFHKQYTESKH